MGSDLAGKLPDDPLSLFEEWYLEAIESGQTMPEAMTLSTADEHGFPSARMVLLKSADGSGFVFFTNYESKKAEDLRQNPRASLVFWWESIRKQVRVNGRVKKVSSEDSNRYFQTRSRNSQLGAWASSQSREIPDREHLENRFGSLSEAYRDKIIPRPPHWGGFLVTPERLEFWIEGAHRLHDRFVYEREEAGKWSLRRLAP